MELLDIVEVLAKNPLIDLSVLENSILSQTLIESYKNSDTHKLRELIAQKKGFSDMSHVIPFSDMSHVLPVIG
ncbi:hypothetical protein SAMN02746093_02874 [Legionella quinlivanii DSM 21216]|uniref:hypothetical protein n=1 Tax=Legionella quinlivanii TaxID=45073 RepID=UPI00089ECCDD|nr:hypothetical protein [Legionella quinlivanii]SEG41943.1 hypothetical protein SAMN02746093_02874 [Legionella quinlivanii DSM 21216]